MKKFSLNEEVEFLELINNINVIEIFDTDCKKVDNLDFLNEILETLEGYEYGLSKSISSIKDRIDEIELESEI